ncbi:hypothetical protein CYMTET_21517, partial [Cymbomonas tetramitiformis]
GLGDMSRHVRWPATAAPSSAKPRALAGPRHDRTDEEASHQQAPCRLRGSRPAFLMIRSGGQVDRSVQLSCGEHTDYGLLTLVNQDSEISALQVKNAAGEWVKAPPLPGTLVCNIGDMLKVWSNGVYQPTLHRVINLRSSKARISVPFFYEPNFDAVVEPLPQFCPPGVEPKYPSVVYGDHLQSKEYATQTQRDETMDVEHGGM